MKETLGPDGVLTADPSLREAFRKAIVRYYNKRSDKSRKDISIRPKSYFERLMMDEFGFWHTLTTHVRGEDQEATRKCGESLLQGASLWLNEAASSK